MNKLKFGIVGVGAVGKVHAENLHKYFANAQLVAVSDVNIESTCSWLHENDIYGVNVYDNEQNVFNAGLDAVLICSPSATHTQFIYDSINAGIKNIFCEKPVDYDINKTVEVIKYAEEKNVKLQLGFHRRFDTSHRKVHEMVKNGDVGKVFIGRFSSRSPRTPPSQYFTGSNGGLFFDTTTHDFDMVRYMTCCEIEEVYAVSAQLGKWTFESSEADTAMFLLKLSNGGFAEIDNCWHAPYGHDQRFEILGEKGMLESQNPLIHQVKFSTVEKTELAKPYVYFQDRYPQAYKAEIQEFIDCILNDEQPSVSGSDGLQSLVCSVAAKRSKELSIPIKISELKKEFGI